MGSDRSPAHNSDDEKAIHRNFLHTLNTFQNNNLISQNKYNIYFPPISDKTIFFLRSYILF